MMKFLHLNLHKTDDKYIGFRYSATGVFGYSFKNGEEEIFRISSMVSMNPDIYMRGFNKNLIHKHYDGQLTLIPGIRRTIVDESGDICGYYEYVNLDEFRMIISGICASVKVTEDGWNVFDGKKEIAKIRRIAKEKITRFEENGYEMENIFEVNVSKNANMLLHPYILAIPMLGF